MHQRTLWSIFYKECTIYNTIHRTLLRQGEIVRTSRDRSSEDEETSCDDAEQGDGNVDRVGESTTAATSTDRSASASSCDTHGASLGRRYTSSRSSGHVAV